VIPLGGSWRRVGAPMHIEEMIRHKQVWRPWTACRKLHPEIPTKQIIMLCMRDSSTKGMSLRLNGNWGSDGYGGVYQQRHPTVGNLFQIGGSNLRLSRVVDEFHVHEF